MKKILFIVFFVLFFLLVGHTYSYEVDESDELKVYMLTLNSVTTKNIEAIKKCSKKIVTVYPDNTYLDIDLFNINLTSSIKDFEQYYLKRMSKVSTTKYYEYKLNGIEIKKVKVVSSGNSLKKCYNYLEKVEPL